jgi:outer membrane lipoprotein-sorting protein
MPKLLIVREVIYATDAVIPFANNTNDIKPKKGKNTLMKNLRTRLLLIFCIGLLGLLAACGGSTTAVTLQDTMKAMQGLQCYHFTATIAMGAAGAIAIEGDVVLPDKLAMTGTTNMAGQTVESKLITIGNTTWINAGGSWITAPNMPLPLNPTTITSSLTNVTSTEDLGDTMLDGKAVHHLRYTVAGSGGSAPSEVWIDKATKYVVQLMSATDSAQGKVEATMKFSRFNDPAITIEAPQ